MSITVTLQQIDSVIVANKKNRFQVNVTNNSASSVTLSGLDVRESTESDAQIGQPNFLTPQNAVGVGNPTILGSATVSYTFDVIFQNPATYGPSPGEVPTSFSSTLPAFPTIAGAYVGQPADASFGLIAQASVSDGSVGSGALTVPVLTSLAPYPPVGTGTLQLQFQPGFNLIGGLVTGLL